ncbi:hypothetical protein BGW38_000640, partial [Lunasporangiospora selenospora]
MDDSVKDSRLRTDKSDWDRSRRFNTESGYEEERPLEGARRSKDAGQEAIGPSRPE